MRLSVYTNASSEMLQSYGVSKLVGCRSFIQTLCISSLVISFDWFMNTSDRRLADHFGGKLHLGYMQIREKLAEMQVRFCNMSPCVVAISFV